MRMTVESSELLESGGEAGSVVVVGLKVDSRSKELLTWALVKVAQSGDRVIALHVLDPNADESDFLSLVKAFDSMLVAYEVFCNLKQVDLKLKVCKGSPVHKIILQEAKSCGATSLIVGTSGVDHKIRSRTSVAKYCSKNLQKNVVSVICVNNGKIVFGRESNASCAPLLGRVDVKRPRSRRNKLSKSPLSLPPQRLSTSYSNETQNVSMAMVSVKTRERPESKSGWAVLRKFFCHGLILSESPSSKKSSVLRRILSLPSRLSNAAIYPDQKQTSTSECLTYLDPAKGDSVPYSVENNSYLFSSKIFSNELNALTEKYSATCQLFSYQELLLATNNFIPENLIGKGGSSRVYRGCLPGGQELAVKILKPSEDILKQFVSEIEIISCSHHKNIISLVGFCFEENKLLLVYNIFSRGSLEDNLHGAEKSKNFFGWDMRYKVALGVAEALDYLHSSAEPIIHRDVKSSNILLSDDFEPKLSDFGLATRASSIHHMCTSDVAGTFGYLAPEYFMNGKLNEKLDVYAFGVVLLELLTGRKPINDGSSKGKQSLVMWAKDILKDGKISELQDPELVDAYDQEQFDIMVSATTLCTRHAPQSRPEISLVLKLLQGDPAVVEWARQETETCEDLNMIYSKQSATDIQSFINLALHDSEDDSTSSSSTELDISVEDYLGSRWSRSSSLG
ncbi:probable serine/threonine-protein kinase PBL5 [Salvia splendens]|uniref:probable serine/threonine-protein kinase PBL5 n=1 Tax=Salvia splendens TaxID=180675 RepID=UPI001C27705A|nr:probable serine/threonine-protein kinase PBL5 [Salvia splendens]